MAARRPVDRPRYPPRGARWRVSLLDLPADAVLYRLTLVRHPDPAYFGRAPVNRFDAPDGSYGVCYLGTTLDCCVAELLLRGLARDEPAGTYLLHPDQLRQYYAAWVGLTRPLRLAWLADDGLVHLGIDQRVTGGDNYRLSRTWAAALHRHPSGVDGIFYPSRRHNDLYSVALFDRAKDAVRFQRWGVLGDRAVPDLWAELGRIIDRWQIRLLPFRPEPVDPAG